MNRVTSLSPPVLVCVLGNFRVIARGRPVRLKPSGKGQALLENLALATRTGIRREELLEALWPGIELGLAAQSLNTLVYSLRQTIGVALDGHPPVRNAEGVYRLNSEHGVSVDINAFEAAADHGDRATREGDDTIALSSYSEAVDFYLGDLVPASEVRHVVERERLRARYLTVIGRLAELRFRHGDLDGALTAALNVLTLDSCREDAHRLAMRAYNRLGQRSQALRQYRVCREALQAEFEAIPEPATEELYFRLRTDPSRV